MSDPNLPATLARLPATYEAAQRALAECSRVDECKTWADKAAALASYARQAEDATLHQMALRIQARAVRRCGELLKQVAPSKGGAPTHNGAGVSRTKAASEAGLSQRQKETALRVAAIPEEQFESAVEGQTPPTVTALAERGTAKRNQPQASDPVQEECMDDTPEGRWQCSCSNIAGDVLALRAFWDREFGKGWRKFEVSSSLITLVTQAQEEWRALFELVSRPVSTDRASLQAVREAQRVLRELVAYCGTHDAASLAQGAEDAEVLRNYVATIDSWLDQFVTNLPR